MITKALDDNFLRDRTTSPISPETAPPPMPLPPALPPDLPLSPLLLTHLTLTISWLALPPARAPRASAALFTLSVFMGAWWLDRHHDLVARPSSWGALGALLAAAAWRERGAWR